MCAQSQEVLFIDPYHHWKDNVVEFRLVYQGQLLGASRNNTRAEHKHQIRRYFHPQLKRLWSTNPALCDLNEVDAQFTSGDLVVTERRRIDQLADNYSRGKHRFVPLVTQDLVLACALDVLLMRRDNVRLLIQSGDLDNRLKTLFDALRIPDSSEGMGAPEDDENPFYCLLQDDSLITEVTLKTDMLLTDREPAGKNEVLLVIAVRIAPIDLTQRNQAFGV